MWRSCTVCRLLELEENSGLADIKIPCVVRELPDVLPEKLLGLSPRREVEFVVDLLPWGGAYFDYSLSVAPLEVLEIERRWSLLAKIDPAPSMEHNGFVDQENDDSLSLCIDYWKMNTLEKKKSTYCRGLMTCLTFERIPVFSKIDLLSDYHQVEVWEYYTDKTIFYTHFWHLEFIVMSFGVINAPTTFMTPMNKISRPYLNQYVEVPIDDIFVYSASKEEREQRLRTVLHVLKDHQLKCEF